MRHRAVLLIAALAFGIFVLVMVVLGCGARFCLWVKRMERDDEDA